MTTCCLRIMYRSYDACTALLQEYRTADVYSSTTSRKLGTLDLCPRQNLFLAHEADTEEIGPTNRGQASPAVS